MNAQVPSELRGLLDALLETPAPSAHPASQVQRFKLTLLKKISQSMKPSKINATLDDWRVRQPLYHERTSIIASLDLTHDGLRYYANSVITSRAFQVFQRTEDDRHLHLLCFIAHQFYRVQDTRMDILLAVVQHALNTSKRIHKEHYDATRIEQPHVVQAFVDCVDQGAFSPLRTIEAIAFSHELSDTAKVQRIQHVLTDESPPRHAAQEQRISLQTQAQREADDADDDEVLAAQSRKLPTRVAEIIKVLAFQGAETSALMAAIQPYKATDGAVPQMTPVGFLEPQEPQAVLDDSGTIRASLYKVLLFIKMAEAINGGVLNVRHSYKYRSLDDYLIPKHVGETHRDVYLQRAGLAEVADWHHTLHMLAAQLDQQYHQTNQRMLAGQHPHMHFRKDGSCHVSTPTAEPEESEPRLGILPQKRYISRAEVLATINRFTYVLDAFEPWRITDAHAKPPDRTFLAGIIGSGCCMGTRKIASISSGIAESELESAVHGYFTLDNIHGANDRVVQFMDR